ncbi:hypothetical protein DVR11_04250 [Paracoccus versutus]|nr:hypothetical protein DVR11_04250 [Paracoccus versutus]
MADNSMENLQDMLAHLRANPDDDKECELEFQIPMSALLQMLLRSAQEGTSLKDVMWDALRRADLIGAVVTSPESGRRRLQP